MSATRHSLLLFVNGRRHDVSAGDAFLSLSDFLRRRLGLVGTKIVCSEGDCGACTVLVGRVAGGNEPAAGAKGPAAGAEGKLRYRPVDSCIQFLFQLDGAHVVTVEGLAPDGELNPVQRAMVDCHGSQCGFCTPGFVVAMTAMLEQAEMLDGDGRLDEPAMRYGLTGNLCRCTGYSPIFEAGRALDPSAVRRLDEVYPPAPIVAAIEQVAAEPVHIRHEQEGAARLLFIPTTLAAAVELLAAHPEARVVAGATDVGVQMNKASIAPPVILDLNRVAELAGVEIAATDGAGSAADGAGRQIVAGARATWTELEAVCRSAIPEFHRILTLFGAPQIRHVGTLGGNIANASPIADSLPLLYVLEAELELAGPDGPRRTNINDFYRGYKQVDLRPGELIARVRFRVPDDDEDLRLYKVSRRRDLDISTLTGAILVRRDGDTIAEAAVAFGAVGPTVIRARQTEAFLAGRPFSEETLRTAGDVAIGEIAPISDVRGSRDYRLQLARNVLGWFYHQVGPAPTNGRPAAQPVS